MIILFLMKARKTNMKYQVRKVSSISIKEYYERIDTVSKMYSMRYNKAKKAMDQQKQMLEPCSGIKEKLKVIKSDEYKLLDRQIKRNNKLKDLYLIEKNALKEELTKLSRRKVLESIALNIEYLSNIPYHYKRALNVINESLSDTGIKVYINSYGLTSLDFYSEYVHDTVSYNVSGTYQDIYEKEDTYIASEIISINEIKDEIEYLIPRINTITLLQTYKEEYMKKVNAALNQFDSYVIKEYIKEKSKCNDIR